MHERFGEYGWVSCKLTQVRPPNDKTLVLRGELRNPYSQPIEGVRIIVRLMASGPDKRELDRQQVTLDVEIGAGERRRFNREISTTYAKKFGAVGVTAFAVGRDGSELPIAPEESIVAAETEQAAAFVGDIPLPDALIGIDGAAPSF